MRLINTTTLGIQEFNGDDIPEYAILSHTWEHEECTLQDVRNSKAQDMLGYQKIMYCCEQAEADGIEWAWVDTQVLMPVCLSERNI